MLYGYTPQWRYVFGSNRRLSAGLMSAGLMSAGIHAGIKFRRHLAGAVGWKPTHLNAATMAALVSGFQPAAPAFEFR